MFQINNNPLDTGFSEVITSVRPKAVTSMINNYKDKVKIAVSVFIFVRVFFFLFITTGADRCVASS